MDDPPFQMLAALVTEASDELIPYPMRLALEVIYGNHVPFDTDEERKPLLYSIRSMRTDVEFRSWLHLEAEIVDMEELRMAFVQLGRFFLSAPATDQRAQKLLQEIVPCQTLSNIARIAVREFPGDDQ